jgi:hypothetical protein
MTIRPKQILKLATVFLSVTSSASFAQTQATSATLIAPLAASAPTVVPALVPYSGVAVDRDGRALSAETGITFLIYKEQNGGEPLFTETQSVVPDSTGHYTVRLGASLSSGIPLDLFSSGEARWLEVQIAGEKPQARVLLVSVPYALKAADAATLGGLPASAFALAGTNLPAIAATLRANATVIPDANSTVTTPGGKAGYLPVFTGAATVADSILFSTSTGVGVGDVPNSTAVFDVNGKSIWRGLLNVSRAGTATASKGFDSYALFFQGSSYNSSSKSQSLPEFQLQVEPTGNNTSSPAGTFNVLYNNNGGVPTETGLFINPNGTIHFAPGQTFPGGGGGGAAFCIASSGGFGNGGTTYVAPSFTIPAVNNCSSWSGFTKTAGTVILNTNGAACLSSTGKTLTVSVTSADPEFVSTPTPDYIQLTRSSSSGTFTGGSDQGEFLGGGAANQITCTSSLLTLPDSHD